jgi:hypothetical protein
MARVLASEGCPYVTNSTILAGCLESRSVRGPSGCRRTGGRSGPVVGYCRGAAQKQGRFAGVIDQMDPESLH